MEDDPAAKKKSGRRARGYGGSKTSRFDFPAHLQPSSSGLYEAGGSKSDYGLGESGTTSTASSKDDDFKAYEPVTASRYKHEDDNSSATAEAAEPKKSKSRYKKYSGAKTSYGDLGGNSAYDSPRISSRTTDTDRYQPHHTNYEDSSSRYNPSRYNTSSSSNKYDTGSNKYDTGSSRYGTSSGHSKYSSSYNPSNTDYGHNRYTSGNSRYGTGYDTTSHMSGRYHQPRDYNTSGSNKSHYTPSYSVYQPVGSRTYGSKKYEPQYANVQPVYTDTKSGSGSTAAVPRSETFESRATLNLLKKEDTPEHSVSDSIEKKASRYGGKYETSDGKIYYGGKPAKYKKSKKYSQRRKTMHADPESNEKVDRTSL